MPEGRETSQYYARTQASARECWPSNSKASYMLPRNPMPSIERNDGTLWEASYEVADDGSAMWARGLFDPSRSFCFRKLRPVAVSWWKFWSPRVRYVRTGEVWIGGDMSAAGFTVSTPTA